MKNVILQGNALDVLKILDDESVDMCITSPPYWALRDYGTEGEIWDADDGCKHNWNEHNKKPSGGRGSKSASVGANKNDFGNMRDHDVVSNFCRECPAWRGSFGLETTFDLYIKHLCDIFDEVKRVLKKEGTCWVNIGDTYGGSGKGAGGKTKKQLTNRGSYFKAPKETYVPNNVPKTNGDVAKSLCQIPSRFAIEMTNRGWILRNEIIWYKPNAMPSSAKDRFTVDFEKMFFFTKNKKYYFETQYEPHTSKDDLNRRKNKTWSDKIADGGTGKQNKGRSRTEFCGEKGRNKRTVWKIPTKGYPEAHFAVYPPELIETPIKAGCPEGGIVLDPFIGSGTTAVVARDLDRQYIGIELNPEYIKLIDKRLAQQKLL